MIDNPFLSVVIPVYNGSCYLRETIASVLQQPCKDFELLILDDGSTDDSLRVCNSFVSSTGDTCPKIRIFSHENKGVSKTRNEGIDLARGTAVIFMDQDDAMRSNFYTDEVKRQLLSLNAEGIDLIMNGFWDADEDLKLGTFSSIERKLKCGTYSGNSEELMWNFLYAFHANIYFRTLFFKNDVPTPVRFFELELDVESAFRHISKYASRKILVSDKYNFSIRRNNHLSVSSNWDWLKVYPVKANAYYDILEWHRKYYPQDEVAIRGARIWLLEKIDELIIGYSRAQYTTSQIRSILLASRYSGELDALMVDFPKESHLLRSFMNGKNYQRCLRWHSMVRRLLGIGNRLKSLGQKNDPPIMIKGNLLNV